MTCCRTQREVQARFPVGAQEQQLAVNKSAPAAHHEHLSYALSAARRSERRRITHFVRLCDLVIASTLRELLLAAASHVLHTARLEPGLTPQAILEHWSQPVSRTQESQSHLLSARIVLTGQGSRRGLSLQVEPSADAFLAAVESGFRVRPVVRATDLRCKQSRTIVGSWKWVDGSDVCTSSSYRVTISCVLQGMQGVARGVRQLLHCKDVSSFVIIGDDGDVDSASPWDLKEQILGVMPILNSDTDSDSTHRLLSTACESALTQSLHWLTILLAKEPCYLDRSTGSSAARPLRTHVADLAAHLHPGYLVYSYA